jgi:glucoamylase
MNPVPGPPGLQASAGYVGSSDGRQDFSHNGKLTWEYSAAGPGNIALLGELPRRSVLALAFEAATALAFNALFEPFETTWERQIGAWTQWHANHAAHACVPSDLPAWVGRDFHVDVMPRKELAGRPQD